MYLDKPIKRKLSLGALRKPKKRGLRELRSICMMLSAFTLVVAEAALDSQRA